jgi:hypothetical protein
MSRCFQYVGRYRMPPSSGLSENARPEYAQRLGIEMPVDR